MNLNVPIAAPHRRAAGPRARRWTHTCAAAPLALALIAGGCQKYERRPLELGRHMDGFLARTAIDPEPTTDPAGIAAARGYDLADGVSLAEAEAVALVWNADLRLARLRAGITRATAENSGLWEDPVVAVDLTRIIQSVEHPWKLAATIGLTLPISGRLEIEKQRAGLGHLVELLRVAQSEWTVRASIRRAWAEHRALAERSEAGESFVRGSDEVLTIVDAMEQAGELTRIEARLFRIERAARLTELTLTRSQLREAELRLKSLMGLSPDAPLTFRSASPAPEADLLPVASARRDRLREASPELAVSAAEYEAAEKALELAVREQYPDLVLGPGYGKDEGQDEVLLGISAPLPVFNGNRRAIAEARAQRELSRANAETTLERLLARLAATEIRLTAARERRGILEADIVPMVEGQFADARRVAQLGEVNTLVLLESLARRHETRLRLIDAELDEATAAIDLQELLGPEPVAAPAAAAPSTPTPETQP